MRGKHPFKAVGRLTSIDSSTSVLQLKNVITKLDLLKLNLPVSLAANGNVVQLPIEGAFVDASENGFAAILLRRSQAEREDRLIQKTLVDHLVEWRGNVVHRNGIVSKAKDTIESALRS